MNNHSYKVLEFNKLREELSQYVTVEENQERILELEPFKDMNSLKKELEIVNDFMDFLKFDGGFEPAGMKDVSNITRKSQLVGMYLEPDDLWSLNINLRIFRIFKGRLETLEKYKSLRVKFISVPTLKNFEDLINKAIDPERNIKDDASLDLRELRFQKKNTVTNIKRKFEELFTNPSFAKAI
ncbi:MAG: endonuclease MutS2, partial [Cetobacterium sp.]